MKNVRARKFIIGGKVYNVREVIYKNVSFILVFDKNYKKVDNPIILDKIVERW